MSSMTFSMITQILLLAFWIDLAANLVAEYVIKGDHSSRYIGLRWITKPLLMILLIGIYISAVPAFVLFAVLAFAFGWLGDVFLMFDYQSRFFLLGSGAFLVGHIFYIWDYSLTFGNSADFPLWRLLLYVPVLLIFLVYAFPRINGKMKGKEKSMTMVYGGVLLLMALATLLRLPVVDILDLRFLFVWAGATLFVLSDAILSVDRFHKKMQRGMLWIMSTYAIGQFLIAYGLSLLG
jgi:uncharacterized membrane protein YhhN